MKLHFSFSFSAYAWMPLNGHEFLYLYMLVSAAVFHVFMASPTPPSHLATICGGNSSSCFMALLPLKVEIFYHPAFKIFSLLFCEHEKFFLVSKYPRKNFSLHFFKPFHGIKDSSMIFTLPILILGKY